MKRLLCIYSIAFAFFSFLSLTFGKNFCLIAIAVFALSLVILPLIFIKGNKRLLRDILMFVVFSLYAVLIAYFVSLPYVSMAQGFDGKYLKAEGKVASVSFSDNYTITTVKCKRINGEKSTQNISVIIRNDDNEISLGTQLYFEGVAEFGDSFYSKGKECFLTVFPSYFEIAKPDGIFERVIYNVRNRIQKSANGMNYSEYIKALTIGDKEDLTNQTVEDFKKLGISHVLAISGLHLSIIVLTVYNIITYIGIPHVLSICISVLISLFYILMTGFSPSLLRAAQMMAVFFLSMLIRRKKDGMTSLCFAGWCILVRSQWAMFNIGFLLSFFATFGILTFVRPLMKAYNKSFADKYETKEGCSKLNRKIHSLIGTFINACATTMSATVFTMPIILFTFNEFSVFAVIGNLIIVPIVKYFLMFSSAAVFLRSAGLLIFSYPFAFLSSLIGDVMVFVVSAMSKIAPETISVRSFYLTIGGIIAIVIVAFFFFCSNKVWALPGVTLVLAVYIPLFNLISDGLIYDTAVIDAVSKKGTYTSIVRFKGETYLLDQTSSASSKMGNISNVLSNDNINRVDKAVFITFDERFVERVKSFISVVDIDEIIVVSDGDLDISEIQSVCFDNDINLELMLYCSRYEITNDITAYCESGIGTAFIVENGESSLSVYRSYAEDYFIYDAIDSDILILGGKECWIDNEIHPDGHYMLYE